jgi:uncharacterized membrane protein YkvA (DUF1232 family)
MSSKEKRDNPGSEGRYAAEFQKWIDSLERDVELFSEVVQSEEAPRGARKVAATGLNYLLKQVDLVPDYYRPIGVIDDCIVLRVLADMGAEHNAELEPKHMKAMFRLANECDLLKEFLGDLYRPLQNAVRHMQEEEVRRRAPAAVLDSERLLEDLLRDVEQEMGSYEAVAIQEPGRAERELLSYLRAKLGSPGG